MTAEQIVIAAEVTILWGENVLHVAHLSAGQSFHVGDEDGPPSRRSAQSACDFSIPREKLGFFAAINGLTAGASRP